MMFVRRKGGSSAIADLILGFSGPRAVELKPRRCRESSFFSSSSACASNASVKALASSLNSDNAAVQLFARAFGNESWLIGNCPILAPRLIPGLGDRSSPCSAGIGDVPFPTGFIFSFGGRSGLVEVDGGMLGVRS